ncbi:MAG TPA: hypothetical protein VFE98_08610 [Candidatus Bathyarchaeia archaeon]|nr:hypothetical protein [Candidatus Bathyarchaeia archaeon]
MPGNWRKWIRAQRVALHSWFGRHRQVRRALKWSPAILAMLLILASVWPPVPWFGTNSGKPIDVGIRPPASGFTGLNFNTSKIILELNTVWNIGSLRVSYSAAWQPVTFDITFPFDATLFGFNHPGNLTRSGKSSTPGFWYLTVTDYSQGDLTVFFSFSDIMSRNFWKSTITITTYNVFAIPEAQFLPGVSQSIMIQAKTLIIAVGYPNGQSMDSDTFPAPNNAYAPTNYFGINWQSWTIDQASGGAGHSVRLSLQTHSLGPSLPLPVELKDFVLPIVGFLLGFSVQSYRSRRHHHGFSRHS